MGNLLPFDLPALAHRYHLSRFVETGTGEGDSLAHAANILDAGEPLFKQLYSGEIESSLAQRAYYRFAENPRVEIINAQSTTFLEMILPEIPADEPVLFWLDAHFPGADSRLRGYGAETNETLRLPAETELNVIHRLRPQHRDVIIMDDARIWLDAKFDHEQMPDILRQFCPTERNINFVHALFGDTHTIEVLTKHEGYVLLTPCSE